jgi:hypothetical protein
MTVCPNIIAGLCQRGNAKPVASVTVVDGVARCSLCKLQWRMGK